MELFVFGIILLAAGIIACFLKDTSKPQIVTIVKVVGILGGVVCIVGSCIKTVPTGHTGVVTTFGKVEDYTYEAGVHFDKPWSKVTNMDNRTQKATLSVGAFSSDIQAVDIVYTVNYQIYKSNAQEIYKNIGSDYFEVVVQPKVLEALKGVFAKYNAESLIANRDKLSKEVEDVLVSSVSIYNIEIVSTAIENIDFTDTFTDAVEAKQVAEQNKLKAQTEQEQLIIEANAQAEKVKIEAQAQADAQIIAAQADAEVAKIGADAAEYQGQKDAAIMSNLGAMLSKYPNLLQYYYTQAWDGSLPETYLGDDASLLLEMNPYTTGTADEE